MRPEVEGQLLAAMARLERSQDQLQQGQGETHKGLAQALIGIGELRTATAAHERHDTENFTRIESRLERLEARLGDTREDVAEVTGRHQAISIHDAEERQTVQRRETTQEGRRQVIVAAVLGGVITLAVGAASRLLWPPATASPAPAATENRK